MAVVVAGNTAIDMNNPAIGALADGDAVSANASYISLATDGVWLDEFFGAFQYDLFGDLAGGTLNRWRESYQGQLVFDVSGFSVPVSTFLSWVAADANVLAVSTILSGDDQVTGSDFSDILRSHAGNDSVLGGGGEDNIDSAAGNDTVFAGAGDDIVRDGSGANYLRGDDGNDSIVGGTGFDDINGNMGNDTGWGGIGDDWVVGGKDNDSLTGESGNDLVYGNLGADSCFGGDGADTVRGGQGVDQLQGGAGNDYLSGDRENDTMTGGSGADIFHGHSEAGIDRITDFNRTEGDQIQLLASSTYSVAQVGADTVITIGGGGAQLILAGVSMSSLTGTWITA